MYNFVWTNENFSIALTTMNKFPFPIYGNCWCIGIYCDSYINVQNCDMNSDGEIDQDEFCRFIMKMTADTFTVVSQRLIFTLAVAPTVATVAVAKKRATERVPGFGKVVQRLPNPVYASLVTLAVVWFLRFGKDSEK